MNVPQKRTRVPLDQLVGEVNPDTKAYVAQRMALAVRISNALCVKGWTKVQFANQMGKEPSEITKWLSGTHNFTVNTLTAIGLKLDIDFFATQASPAAEVKFMTLFMPMDATNRSSKPRYQDSMAPSFLLTVNS